jgi:uncharacterized protein YecE (DUF72 family)
MATSIYIGTSGWSYPTGEGTWKDHFYPPGTRDELSYYSEFLNAVEVNSSFYVPIKPAYAARWARRVHRDFRFSVKLWQKFTHPKMFEQATGQEAAISAADVDTFRKGLEPLAAAGKLGALVAQFPPSFTASEDNRSLLRAVSRTFSEYPLAVELRHRSWSDNPATAALLTELRAAWVGVDEPRFAISANPRVPVTAPLAYFRFHGRNAEDWWRGNNETRYRYLYSQSELTELAARVRAAEGQVTTLFAFFNNHWQGWAPKNAVELRQLVLPLEDNPGKGYR